MAKRDWKRVAALGIAASGLALAPALLACGESKNEELEHGNAVDAETSTPESQKEMQMTEEERRAKEAAQEETLERKEFNDSGQGDNPAP